jgi:diguanylate cyclase (GGDEF)-like protein
MHGVHMTSRSPIPAAPSCLVQLLLVPALFYLGARLSLAFSLQPGAVVVLWMPNGVLLAALLHYGLRRFLPFAGTVLLAEVAADYPAYPVSEALLYGLINLGEATAAWWILRRWRFDPSFAAPADLGRFLLAGPAIAAFCAAVAATGVNLLDERSGIGALSFLRLYWFSDGVGLLLATPLVLSLWPAGSGARVAAIPLQWYDLVVGIVALGVLSMFLMSQDAAFAGWPVRPILLLPFVFYASVRLTPRSTTMVITLFAIALLFVAHNGQRPYGDIPMHQTAIQVQQFLTIMAVGGLGIASLLAQLRANVAHLESRVADRTAQLRAANERLLQMAVTDPLTGLANRRALNETLQREIERSRRHGHALGVVLFDIDRFKAVNDTYGHGAGDRVLRHVAEVAAGIVRASDLLGRYGGEEFLLLAPETDRSKALYLAERIRTVLHDTAVQVDHTTIHVSASFGVALLQESDRDAAALIARADAALYAAKAAGRDQVIVAP